MFWLHTNCTAGSNYSNIGVQISTPEHFLYFLNGLPNTENNKARRNQQGMQNCRKTKRQGALGFVYFLFPNLKILQTFKVNCVASL